ncbi:MAG TPA: hypothetical protein PKD00_00815 [Burkholderiales bacterium]|nr:hypothetical protein [Burkholderiales bacterium]
MKPETEIKFLKEKIKVLSAEKRLLEINLKAYKEAYNEIAGYYDSIDEEQQEILSKKLNKIFKPLNK